MALLALLFVILPFPKIGWRTCRMVHVSGKETRWEDLGSHRDGAAGKLPTPVWTKKRGKLAGRQVVFRWFRVDRGRTGATGV